MPRGKHTLDWKVRWMPAWIMTLRMTEIMNVGAMYSEIMFDSIMGGHWRSEMDPPRKRRGDLGYSFRGSKMLGRFQ
jgi:hypothetical protein